jgi:purine-binding chemotaxis protein CheW
VRLPDDEELLVFELEGVSLALPASRVDEVLRAAALLPLPTAPPVVMGLLDLRGAPVPVLDLRPRLGLPARPLRASEHFVVFRALGRQLALRVDRALDVARGGPTASFEADAAFAPDALLAGVTRRPGGLLLIHDPDRFLSSDEVLALDASVRGRDDAGTP